MASRKSSTENQLQNEPQEPPQRNERGRQKPISERRRMQNRQSQKTFREKHRRQKQLLKHLESSQSTLLESPISPSSQSFTAFSAYSGQTAETTVTDSPFSQGDDNNDRSQFPANMYNTANYSFDDLCHGFIHEERLANTPRDHLLIPLQLQDIQEPEPWNLVSWTDSIGDLNSLNDHQKSPTIEHRQKIDPGDLLAHLLLRSDEQIDDRIIEQILRKELDICDILRAGLSVLSTERLLNRYADWSTSPWDTEVAKCTLEASQLTGQKFNPFRKDTEGFLGEVQTMNPENKTTFVCLSFREACAVNAAALKFPSTYIHPDSGAPRTLLEIGPGVSNASMGSPFFRPMLSKKAAEKVCKQGFTDMKPDLRPVVSQLLNNHYAYLDTLPFPKFRERAISLIYANPPIIDECELFHDLLNNGLICWGLDAKRSNMGTSIGSPWNFRSWEAQPWFLRKWWILVGGTQGEIYMQTVWWREMRGEPTSDLLPDN